MTLNKYSSPKEVMEYYAMTNTSASLSVHIMRFYPTTDITCLSEIQLEKTLNKLVTEAMEIL